MHSKNGISIIAIIATIAILLQPFSAVVAMDAMALHHNMEMPANSGDHCADHVDDELPADVEQPPGSSPDCLDECELCVSAAGPFLMPRSNPTKYSPHSEFERCAFVNTAAHQPELLYRPPILS